MEGSLFSFLSFLRVAELISADAINLDSFSGVLLVSLPLLLPSGSPVRLGNKITVGGGKAETVRGGKLLLPVPTLAASLTKLLLRFSAAVTLWAPTPEHA
jgi:hypothetical protein